MKKLDKKSNFYIALQLFGAHLASIFIANICCFSLSFMMTNTVGLIFAIPIILLIYCVSVYAVMWGQGNKDLNAIHFGHIEEDKYRGFKISFIANIPFFILSVLLILTKVNLMGNFSTIYIVIYKMINAEVWPIINIINPIADPSKIYLWQIIIIALLPIIPVFIHGFAYIMGLNDFSPVQKLVYKNKKKKTAQKTIKR